MKLKKWLIATLGLFLFALILLAISKNTIIYGIDQNGPYSGKNIRIGEKKNMKMIINANGLSFYINEFWQ